MAKASRVAAQTANTLQELSEQVAALAERVEELYALVSNQQPKEGDLEPSFLKAKKAAAKPEKEG
jgi:uncharacterized coiled-coil protein SlyX